jgi:xanthine dehydrogenase accessory factor
MFNLILLRGGGDLASGVALRLWRSGLKVIITELPQPLAIRRSVAFASAVFDGETTVEGLTAQRVDTPAQALDLLTKNILPVLIDPHMDCLEVIHPLVIVDGRMEKQPPELGLDFDSLVIGLGPGFTAGVDCHAVIETRRGPNLGRVLWQGSAEPDTASPEPVNQRSDERVLRAPTDGTLHAYAAIGDLLQPGDPIAEVNGKPINAKFEGILRGLIHPGIHVRKGTKIGDLDPRIDQALVRQVSDKALAVGGGVLEAILSRAEIRSKLWN